MVCEASVNVGCHKNPVDKLYKLLTVVACVFYNCSNCRKKTIRNKRIDDELQYHHY